MGRAKGKGKQNAKTVKTPSQAMKPQTRRSQSNPMAVANVNKSPKTRSQAKLMGDSTPKGGVKTVRNIVAKRKSQGVVEFDEIDFPKRQRAEPSEKLRKTDKPEAKVDPNNSEGPADITFHENDQEIQMEVEADEDVFDTESSVSDESESSYASDSADKGETSNQESDGALPSTSASDSQREQPAVSPVRQGAQARIQEIDAEMKEKLRELEKMMIQGGLTESVKVMEGLQKRIDGTPCQRSEGNVPHITFKEANNENQNATRRKTCNGKMTEVLAKLSEETIYNNAVQRQTSHSSDEVDTSDEFLHGVSFDDFTNDNSIPEPVVHEL